MLGQLCPWAQALDLVLNEDMLKEAIPNPDDIHADNELSDDDGDRRIKHPQIWCRHLWHLTMIQRVALHLQKTWILA